MYPTTIGQWSALLTAVMPLILWALSSLVAAVNAFRHARREQWKRLHHLTAVIYNKDHASGELAQIVAINEMGSLWIDRKTILRLARLARDHFARESPQGAIKSELEALIRKLTYPQIF
jgi:hypothetical protein